MQISQEEIGEEMLMSYDAITTNSDILEYSEYNYIQTYQRLPEELPAQSPRRAGRNQSSITIAKTTYIVPSMQRLKNVSKTLIHRPTLECA